MAQVLFPDTDRASGIDFKPLKRLNNGGMRVEMFYKKDGTEQEVLYQTCNFRRGYVKEWIDEKSGKKSLKLECLLLGYDNPYTDCFKFTEGWKEVEGQVVSVAKQRTQEWFKKAIPEATIETYWTSRIRPASDPSKYSPTIMFTVPLNREGKPDVEIYDDRARPATWEAFEEATRDGEFCCIVRVPSVYFMPKSFGCSVQLHSVQFFPSKKVKGFAFRKREASDDEGPEAKRRQSDDEEQRAAEAFL